MVFCCFSSVSFVSQNYTYDYLLFHRRNARSAHVMQRYNAAMTQLFSSLPFLLTTINLRCSQAEPRGVVWWV